MASNKIDYKEYIAWVRQLADANADVHQWLKEFLLKQAQEAVDRAKMRTPVDTGALRASYQIGGQEIALDYYQDENGKDHFKVDDTLSQKATTANVGDDLTVVISNPMEYASWVEYGHKQEVGRYVPALGKRLKNPWVEGRYMLTISVDEVQQILPQRLHRQFEKYLKDKGVVR